MRYVRYVRDVRVESGEVGVSDVRGFWDVYKNKLLVDDARNPRWFPSDVFKPVTEQRVIPNHFFAFAPNNHSWHSAAIDRTKMKGVDEHARRTFLGFVTPAHEKSEYHMFDKQDWADHEFFI